MTKIPDANEIRKLYVDDEMSIGQIAKQYNTYSNHIRRIMQKNGIPIRSHSEAQKNALKKGTVVHPTKGKKRSEEVKDSISKAAVARWDGDEEAKDALRIRTKERWDSLSETERGEIVTKAQSAVRDAAQNGSKLEKALQIALTEADFVVEYHKMDLVPNAKLEVDMFLPQYSVAIEIDGPSHFLPIWGEETLRRNQKSDMEKYGLLRNNGVIVVRLKNMNRKTTRDVQNRASALLLEALATIVDGSNKKHLIELEV